MYKCVCEVCGHGPETNGTAVYRTGEKGPGKNPHWRCSVHMPSSAPADPVVQEVVALIENSNSTKH